MSEIQAVFNEFKEWEKLEHHYIRDELRSLHSKVDDLREFKWKMMGQISVISFATSGLTAALFQIIVRTL